jgi:hypothetical protein
MPAFSPDCLPVLIGSLPMADHQEAVDLIFKFTPRIPLWPQLPVNREEGMIPQFIPGLPGIVRQGDKIYIDSGSEEFQAELLEFYEEYMAVTDGEEALDGSRFALSPEVAQGFFTFLTAAEKHKGQTVALKGQTTGPVTFCTALADQQGRAIFYDDQLRDVAVKHLALKARWQVEKMAPLGGTPIMFFDEPGLAGLGSSAFITITTEDILESLGEVFEAVRQAGGLTGVHVCANTEWSVIFDSGVDIISYDAYGFFDKLVLYGEQLVKFLRGGGILACGIVPTAPEFIDLETVDSLVEKWFSQCGRLEETGLDRETIFRQTMITPSCGTGAVSRAQADKVLELTGGVSERLRAAFA